MIAQQEIIADYSESEIAHEIISHDQALAITSEWGPEWH
jgi:hypothetical protein